MVVSIEQLVSRSEVVTFFSSSYLSWGRVQIGLRSMASRLPALLSEIVHQFSYSVGRSIYQAALPSSIG